MTKHGIFFTSRPFLQESKNANSIKIYKDQDNPLKQLIVAKNKLIQSDTGKIKTRLTLYETMNLLTHIQQLMKTTHKTSMSSFVYQDEDELMKG